MSAKEKDDKILLKSSEIKSSLINPTPNDVRDFVRESRDSDLEAYKRECNTEYRLSKDRSHNKHASNNREGGDVVDIVRRWEFENNKYNADLWTPTKKRGGKITPDMLDKLYHFWDNFLETYEEDHMNNEQYRHPIDKTKVFDLLISRFDNNTNQTPEELREIQTQIERMTMHFDEGSVYESAGQLLDQNKLPQFSLLSSFGIEIQYQLS